MAIGDSKTFEDLWPQFLAAAISTSTGLQWVSGDGGIRGATTASYVTTLAATLATFNPTNPPNVRAILNFGANDSFYMPTEAAWKADYLTIIDAVVAKWPGVLVYLTRPWVRGKAAECNLFAAWIDDIVAARPGVVFVGDDERVWMEGGNDGATMTVDGVHYSGAGQVAGTAAKKAAMGY